MKENLPEEKLLKLIRGKKGEKGAVPSRPVIKTPQPFKIEPKYFFNFINSLLAVTVTGLVIFLTYRGIFLSRETKERLTAPLSGKEAEGTGGQGQDGEKPPLQYYKEQFAKRDLFERPLDQVAANAGLDLTKRYKLVGIFLGATPEAIIEDLATRATVFVHEGDILDTVQVQKISEGRVIFLQDGLEVELKQ